MSCVTSIILCDCIVELSKNVFANTWPGVRFVCWVGYNHFDRTMSQITCLHGQFVVRIDFFFSFCSSYKWKHWLYLAVPRLRRCKLIMGISQCLFPWSSAPLRTPIECLHVCCSHTEVRGFACVSEWFGKSSPVLDTEIINPFGVGSSFTLSMILQAAYHRVRVWVKRKGNKRQQGESSGMRMS